MTLKGLAHAWFGRLKPGFIDSFLDLSKQFVSHFISARSYWKPVTHLLNIKQEREESLRNYITRFNKEALQVDDTNDKVILTTLMGGLQPSRFMFSLSKSPPNTLEELMVKAEKHINAEEAMFARRGGGELEKRKRIDGSSSFT